MRTRLGRPRHDTHARDRLAKLNENDDDDDDVED